MSVREAKGRCPLEPRQGNDFPGPSFVSLDAANGGNQHKILVAPAPQGLAGLLGVWGLRPQRFQGRALAFP